jgi:hypothetical protein
MSSWIYFISISEFIYHRSVPGEYEHFRSNSMGPSVGAQKQNDFNNICWNFRNLWRQSPYIKLLRRHLQENKSMPISVSNMKCQFSSKHEDCDLSSTYENVYAMSLHPFLCLLNYFVESSATDIYEEIK